MESTMTRQLSRLRSLPLVRPMARCSTFRRLQIDIWFRVQTPWRFLAAWTYRQQILNYISAERVLCFTSQQGTRCAFMAFRHTVIMLLALILWSWSAPTPLTKSTDFSRAYGFHRIPSCLSIWSAFASSSLSEGCGFAG